KTRFRLGTSLHRAGLITRGTPLKVSGSSHSILLLQAYLAHFSGSFSGSSESRIACELPNTLCRQGERGQQEVGIAKGGSREALTEIGVSAFAPFSLDLSSNLPKCAFPGSYRARMEGVKSRERL
ncbi:MAG: hypothetical protein ACI87A_002613, partial [Planctomycetota bacterium]